MCECGEKTTPTTTERSEQPVLTHIKIALFHSRLLFTTQLLWDPSLPPSLPSFIHSYIHLSSSKDAATFFKFSQTSSTIDRSIAAGKAASPVICLAHAIHFWVWSSGWVSLGK